jgi:hypothetical protein
VNSFIYMRSSARRPILLDSTIRAYRLRYACDSFYNKVIINIYESKNMIRGLLR